MPEPEVIYFPGRTGESIRKLDNSMRSKKAMKNIVTSMIQQIVTIVCGLITPRLILANFGSTYNGVVNSATQFLSMITILNIGIAGATRVALYPVLAENDILGVSRIMKATKRYMRKVGICVLLYALVLCIFYPLIAHNDLTHMQNAALIAIVSIGTFAQYFFGISNQTLLSADQSIYVNTLINIAKSILNTILVAVLIYFGASIYVVKLGSSIVFFIAPFVLEIYVQKKYKLLRNCDPDDSAIKGRGAVAFHSVANIIHNKSDLIILTLFADAKVISVYTVYYLAVGEIKSLMNVFINGLEAAFGNMWAKKQYGTLAKNFRLLEFALYSFTGVVFSCAGILILPFVSVYTRGVNDINYIIPSFAVLVTIAEGVFCVRQSYLILVQATGNYESTKKGAMVEAVLNITTSLALVGPFGINGVMFGTLTANVFRTFQYALFVSKQVLNRPVMVFVRRMLWLVADIAVVVVVSVYAGCFSLTVTGWEEWIYKALITFLISCMITVSMDFLFYRSDLLEFYNLIKRMIGVKSRTKA